MKKWYLAVPVDGSKPRVLARLGAAKRTEVVYELQIKLPSSLSCVQHAITIDVPEVAPNTFTVGAPILPQESETS